MRKPKDLKYGKWDVWPFAYVLDHDEYDEYDDPDSPRKVVVDAGDGLTLQEAKRLRAWLDKAIAWMEAK